MPKAKSKVKARLRKLFKRDPKKYVKKKKMGHKAVSTQAKKRKMLKKATSKPKPKNRR